VLAALALLVLQDPAVPQSLGWDDFPVFVWREEHTGKPLPPELAEPFGGVILMRGEDSAWARERGLAYMVWNVAGREPFHLDADEAWRARVERWIETKDEALLVREPCLSDPKTLERAFATLEATQAQHGAHPGMAFVLGDEVSLTPNGAPFDLCRCTLCLERWKEHAMSRGLDPAMPRTDDVLAALRAGRTDGLGAWLELRRFRQQSLLDLLTRLGEKITAGGAVTALLGMAGETAFGGVATERVPFPVVETYPLPGLRELADQPRRHEQQVPPWRRELATLFFEEESPAGATWLLFEHWLNGADGIVLWSDRTLARAPALRARLAEAVGTIRMLQAGEPARWTPHSRYSAEHRPGRLALIVDPDSNALAFLHDALDDGKTWPRRFASYQQEHGSNERRLQAWLAALERAEAPTLVTTLDAWRHELESGAQLRLAILAGRRVVDAADLELLARATKRGLLVIDGPFAEVDRFGRKHTTDPLAALRAALGERLVVCDTRASEGVFEQISDWMTRLGFETPPSARFTGKAAEQAWITFHARPFPSSEDRWRIAALPSTREPAERRRLTDLPLTAEPPPGWELRWIHPQGEPRVLRAGEAAIYELVDTAAEAERARRRKNAGPR